jgi:hypothetical protein
MGVQTKVSIAPRPPLPLAQAAPLPAAPAPRPQLHPAAAFEGRSRALYSVDVSDAALQVQGYNEIIVK